MREFSIRGAAGARRQDAHTQPLICAAAGEAGTLLSAPLRNWRMGACRDRRRVELSRDARMCVCVCVCVWLCVLRHRRCVARMPQVR